MIPVDAGFLTQIILKDLSPMLYPLRPEYAHYTAALRSGKTNEIRILSRYDALRIYDPSGHMQRAWKLIGIEGASGAFETKTNVWHPKVGQQLQVKNVWICREDTNNALTMHYLQVPKSRKGQSCKHALLQFPDNAETVWAETKYDGERCQIHVEIRDEGVGHITIFSKSGRDSTFDRYGIHDVIRTALGCGPCKKRSLLTRNVILDAEMVAFRGITIER